MVCWIILFSASIVYHLTSSRFAVTPFDVIAVFWFKMLRLGNPRFGLYAWNRVICPGNSINIESSSTKRADSPTLYTRLKFIHSWIVWKIQCGKNILMEKKFLRNREFDKCDVDWTIQKVETYTNNKEIHLNLLKLFHTYIGRTSITCWIPKYISVWSRWELKRCKQFSTEALTPPISILKSVVSQ